MRWIAAEAFVFLLVCAPIQAASILSTSCRLDSVAEGTTVINSTADCSLVGPPVAPYIVLPYAEARASTHYETLSEDLSETIPEGAFWGTAGVFTAVGQPHDGAYSEARAYAELSLRATTAGPVRAGILDFDFTAFIALGRATLPMLEAAIGPLFAKRVGEDCVGTCGGRFPFVLGQPFDIRVVAFSESRADSQEGMSYGGADARLAFQLRELDGTPVDFNFHAEPSPIPEPAALLLVGSGLLLLPALRVVRRG